MIVHHSKYFVEDYINVKIKMKKNEHDRALPRKEYL
jgi:hypothetical protein